MKNKFSCLYELSNHLGNVLTVVSDRKIAVETSPGSGIVDHFIADIVSANDYYAFGAPMPGRQFNSSSYKYGFNGQEKDDEVKGSGNSYDFGARIYDPRLGRFLSIDPKWRQFAYWSPYLFAANNPIRMVDENGEGPGDKVKIADVRNALSAIPDEGAKYQFTLYVDQPIKGSRRQIKLISGDVGHTFIKITKTSADGKKVVEVAFGFYPSKKEGGAAGSPINPDVESTFKDNNQHIYDEAIIKDNITQVQIDKLLNVANGFESAPYCLASQNCTDFGLAAADAVDLKLPNTQVKIPFTGKGTTPADLGQDILDGKVSKQEGVTTDTKTGTAVTQNKGEKAIKGPPVE